MRKETGHFLSSDNKTNICFYMYYPEGEPVKIMQICHGMTEHIERYEEFAKYFCDRGFLVCGNDHKGHGNSSEPEDWGYFGEEGIGTLVEDVNILNGLVKEKYPSVPYILFGHSMGSFVAREYIVKYADNIDAVILSGTSGGDVPVEFAKKLTRFIAKVKGERKRSKLVDTLSSGTYNSHFKGEGKYAWLTKDKSIQEKYAADPKCTFKFTLNGYYGLFSILADISKDEWAKKVRKNLPVFLAGGSEDPVGNYGKGITIVENKLKEAGVEHVIAKIYENDRHELHNELDKDKVCEDYFEFINEYTR